MGATQYGRRETDGGILALAILVTIFCCLPTGIASIVFAAQGDNDRAKTWAAVSAVLGIGQAIFVVVALS